MLKLLFDSIILRIRSVIFTIILCTVSIVLFSIAIYMYEDSKYGERKTDELLAEGVNHTGEMSVASGYNNEMSVSLDYTSDKINKLRIELFNIDGITSVGENPTLEPVLSNMNELHEIQSKYTDMKGCDSGCIKGVFVNNTSLRCCNISLYSGELLEELNQDKDCYYLYLGYNLKEVPLGTQYTIPFAENGEKKEAKVIVKGILSKNTEYINSNVITNTNTNTIISDECSIHMDNYIMVVNNHYYSNTFMYSVDSLYDIEQIDEQIDSIAKRNGLKVNLAHVSEIFKEKKESSHKLLKTILQLLSISTIVSITIMICMQVLLILNNLSEYGILCANGYRIKDISYMLLIENFIKTAIAYFVAVYLSAKIILYSFSTYADVQYVFYDIFYNHVIIKVGVISVLIAIVSSIIPVFVLRKYKVVNLIGGNNE